MTTNTSSHLATDKVNLLELKDWLRREFLSFFEDCNGKKVRKINFEKSFFLSFYLIELIWKVNYLG